jgi:hypothetical protein
MDLPIRDSLIELLQGMRSNVIHNYIVPGLSSYLLRNGKVRLFEASRHQHHAVVPHSHRFDFMCLVLRGHVDHTVWEPRSFDDQGDEWAIMEVRGTFAEGYKVQHSELGYFAPVTKTYGVGGWYGCSHDEVHSVRFSSNALVLFIEGAPRFETHFVLSPVGKKTRCGDPDILRTPEWMFEHGEVPLC